MPTKLDKEDAAIIQLLQADARTSNREIARLTGLSEGTVRYRLKRLLDQKVIHPVAVADPAKLGFEVNAIIGLHVRPSNLDEVYRALNQISAIRWLALTTGRYDIIGQVILPRTEDLAAFLKTQLSAIRGLESVETSLVLEISKAAYTWGVILDGGMPKDGGT